MAKKKKDNGNLGKAKLQNLVAKHSQQMAGAGQHVDKQGEKAPRNRQKRTWKKESGMLESIAQSARSLDPFDQAIREIEKQFNISLKEGSCGSENEESLDKQSDMAKLIKQYKAGKASADSESVAMDLEQLGYDPDDIEQMVQHIMKSIQMNESFIALYKDGRGSERKYTIDASDIKQAWVEAKKLATEQGWKPPVSVTPDE